MLTQFLVRCSCVENVCPIFQIFSGVLDRGGVGEENVAIGNVP